MDGVRTYPPFPARVCVSAVCTCVCEWVLAQQLLALLHCSTIRTKKKKTKKKERALKKCHKIWVHALQARITIIAKLCRWKILKKWFSFKLPGKLSSCLHTQADTHIANEGVKKVLRTPHVAPPKDSPPEFLSTASQLRVRGSRARYATC